MRLIERIAEQYSKIELKSISVPEWGDDVTVYYKPLTADELDAVTAEMPEGSSGTRSNVQVIILKALDASGKRLFSNAEAGELSGKSFAETINRVAGAMIKVVTVEQAVKNSGDSPI